MRECGWRDSGAPQESSDLLEITLPTLTETLLPLRGERQDQDQRWLSVRRDPEYAPHRVETPQLATYYVAFNSYGGLLARQTLGRGAIPAHGFIPPGLLGHDPAARHAIYREIEEILAREALMLPLFHEQAYRFAWPEVEGLALSVGGDTAYEELRIRG